MSAARAPRPAAGAARSPALASRSAALDVLAAVLEGGTSLDDALDAGLGKAGPEPRDRAFARSLATTTIRRLGQIDDAIGRLADTARPLRPQSLMQVLRLGAAQLLFLQTPPHAAVATSVDLADMLGLGRGKGLVNAVLRRLAREGDAILGEQDAARLNTPDWLWRRWTDAFGEAAARAIALQHMVEPPLDLTLKPSEAPLPWAEALSADIMPNGTLRRALGGRIQDMPGFAQGAWWVQDLAAALPAGLFGDVRGLGILDVCAAPGGKTAQLAAAGARVTAVDRSPARLAMVRDNLQRLGLSAELVAADALAWAPPAGAPADAVLLDAPCLATGTIRRHPDVARAKRPQDLAQLTRLQAELLGRAWKWLRPGGTMIYCTCSLEPEEGELQIERFLAGRPEMARRPIQPEEIGGLGMLIDHRGDLRSLPFHLADQGGMDGFFAARLARKP